MKKKFVGHIGGDDFVAIVGGIECEQICQNIVAEFDREVVKYFTPEDVEKDIWQCQIERNNRTISNNKNFCKCSSS